MWLLTPDGFWCHHSVRLMVLWDARAINSGIASLKLKHAKMKYTSLLARSTNLHKSRLCLWLQNKIVFGEKNSKDFVCPVFIPLICEQRCGYIPTRNDQCWKRNFTWLFLFARIWCCQDYFVISFNSNDHYKWKVATWWESSSNLLLFFGQKWTGCLWSCFVWPELKKGTTVMSSHFHFHKNLHTRPPAKISGWTWMFLFAWIWCCQDRFVISFYRNDHYKWKVATW